MPNQPINKEVKKVCILCFFTILFFSFSCQKNKEKDKTECIELNNKNNNRKFQCKKFDKNGNLIEVKNFTDDSVLHGPYKEFYPSGTLKVKGEFYNGDKIQYFKHFRKDGKIKKKFEYIKIIGDSKRNRVYIYDKKERLKKKKGAYFEVEMEDTIKINEVNNISVEFYDIPFDSVEIFYGAYGPLFGIKDSSKMTIERYSVNNFSFQVNPKKTGENVIRTTFALFSDTSNDSIMKSKTFFMNYPYYVTE